jgi:hypothetical protein
LNDAPFQFKVNCILAWSKVLKGLNPPQNWKAKETGGYRLKKGELAGKKRE